MNRTVPFVFLALLTAACALSSCAGSATTGPTPTPPSCGMPPPVPMTNFALAEPSPGATGVPDSTTTLIFAGTPFDFFGPPQVQLTSPSGVNYTYWDFSNNYPTCKAQTTIPLGTFTTQ
jgi:hypothetical protein